MKTFYLGTHRPSWIEYMEVPLFLSASTIHRMQRERRKYRSISSAHRAPGPPAALMETPAAGQWAFDSGAYMANNPNGEVNYAHPWHEEPDTYGGIVLRVIDEMGVLPDFIAPQDWPCEEPVRAVTGYTVYEHQALTLENYLYLAEQFAGPWLRWLPVLQGWSPYEYIRHIEMYEQAGVCLADFDRVGLGSVCRRGSIKPVVAVVEAVQSYALQRYGQMLPLHGFGLNVLALRKVAHLLESSDSLAWSDGARRDRIRLPECAHQSRYCNNCPRYAMTWYRKVIEAVEAPKQLSFDLIA